ncbi:MAG: hypothetical protein ABH882_03625 [Candidatus Omnitrophota bacterium]|nr:hypothetical protein [Candidatus Omnitrophota bacterium]MBU1928249.1 hypothetical protein [Candidatus Omnitrophota bacterium]MBU2034775.1 hypothetical protein [Candidatus Omnitrophota bacterium]MBU2222148.1 hypothetical protein [Candidatus Omnitrophota bacterium]MBU2258875.1 hypothetical protein [Candidatus Omnitrophota bacterium]
MQTIRDTVQIVINGLRGADKKRAKDNPRAWLKKALSKKELNHIGFKYFSKGILGLKVDSSSWLYYASLHKEELLGKLNKNSMKVKDIRFWMGEIGEK